MAIQRLDGLWEQSEHLNFRDNGKRNPKAVTRVFGVYSRNSGVLLGQVRWFATWRQYTFHPVPDTSFDPRCLTELAEYCSMKTAEHKAK